MHTSPKASFSSFEQFFLSPRANFLVLLIIIISAMKCFPVYSHTKAMFALENVLDGKKLNI